MTYTEKARRIAAQHAYDARIVREGVAAALAPYRLAEGYTSEPGPLRP